MNKLILTPMTAILSLCLFIGSCFAEEEEITLDDLTGFAKTKQVYDWTQATSSSDENLAQNKYEQIYQDAVNVIASFSEEEREDECRNIIDNWEGQALTIVDNLNDARNDPNVSGEDFQEMYDNALEQLNGRILFYEYNSSGIQMTKYGFTGGEIMMNISAYQTILMELETQIFNPAGNSTQGADPTQDDIDAYENESPFGPVIITPPLSRDDRYELPDPSEYEGNNEPWNHVM